MTYSFPASQGGLPAAHGGVFSPELNGGITAQGGIPCVRGGVDVQGGVSD